MDISLSGFLQLGSSSTSSALYSYRFGGVCDFILKLSKLSTSETELINRH